MYIKFQILFIITFLFISLSEINSTEGLATSEKPSDASSSSFLREIPIEVDSVPLMLSPLSPLAHAKAASLETYFDKRQEERKEQEELEIAILVSKSEQKSVSPDSQIEELRLQRDIIRAQLETLKLEIDKRTMRIASISDYTSSLELNELSIETITRMLGKDLNENQIDEDQYIALLEEEARLDLALTEAMEAAHDKEDRVSPAISAAASMPALSSEKLYQSSTTF